MNTKSRNTLLVGVSVLLFIGCSKSTYVPYTPSAEDVQKSGVTEESLLAGRQLFTTNCDRCHGLKAPERFTSAEWAKIMPRMQKKAKMSNADANILSQYVLVHAKP